MPDDNSFKAFFDTFFRCPLIQVNGVALPLRNILNLVTDEEHGPEDDPDNERTNIPINGLLSPGGPVGSMQFHKLDGMTAILGGTPMLEVIDDDGNVEHTGKPIHKEDWADFKNGTEDSFARSQWDVGHTTNATPTTIGTISVPAADLGDCAIFVVVRQPYAYVSSGTTIACGIIAMEASFKREAGTLTRIGTQDVSPSGLSSGTAPGGLDVAVQDNDTIKIVATGISAKNLTQQCSVHAQVVKP